MVLVAPRVVEQLFASKEYIKSTEKLDLATPRSMRQVVAPWRVWTLEQGVDANNIEY